MAGRHSYIGTADMTKNSAKKNPAKMKRSENLFASANTYVKRSATRKKTQVGLTVQNGN